MTVTDKASVGGNTDESQFVIFYLLVGLGFVFERTQDFRETGSATTADLFKTLPVAQVPALESSTDAVSRIERTQTVNLRGLNSRGSLGYRTGDTPVNRYLKNISVQLTVTDLLDKRPPFQYSVATNGNIPHAFYNGYAADQRRFTLTLTKAW